MPASLTEGYKRQSSTLPTNVNKVIIWSRVACGAMLLTCKRICTFRTYVQYFLTRIDSTTVFNGDNEKPTWTTVVPEFGWPVASMPSRPSIVSSMAVPPSFTANFRAELPDDASTKSRPENKYYDVIEIVLSGLYTGPSSPSYSNEWKWKWFFYIFRVDTNLVIYTRKSETLKSFLFMNSKCNIVISL